jgi:hypothetical protein
MIKCRIITVYEVVVLTWLYAIIRLNISLEDVVISSKEVARNEL